MTEQGETIISKIFSYLSKPKNDTVPTDLSNIGTTLLLKNICDKHLKIINDTEKAQCIYNINKNFLRALDKLNNLSKKDLIYALPRLHYVYDVIGSQKKLDEKLIEETFATNFFSIPTQAVTENSANVSQRINNYVDINEPSMYYWASEDLICVHKFMQKFFPKNTLILIDKNNALQPHSFKSPCLLLLFITIDDRWNDVKFWIDFTYTKSAETNENSVIVRVHSNPDTTGQINPGGITSKVCGEQVYLTTEVKSAMSMSGLGDGEKTMNNEEKLKYDIQTLLLKISKQGK